jgi:hypothetical protein
MSPAFGLPKLVNLCHCFHDNSTQKIVLLFCRSPSLTTLRLVYCWKIHNWKVFNAQLDGVITKSPLSKLRSLELDNIDLLVEELIAILENCPVLEVLTVRDCLGMDEEDEPVLRAKCARIKTLTYDCVGECIGEDWYDYGSWSYA